MGELKKPAHKPEESKKEADKPNIPPVDPVKPPTEPSNEPIIPESTDVADELKKAEEALKKADSGYTNEGLTKTTNINQPSIPPKLENKKPVIQADKAETKFSVAKKEYVSKITEVVNIGSAWIKLEKGKKVMLTPNEANVLKRHLQ